VIAAFLYAWLGLTNINYTITNVVLIRWLIEATLAPYIFFVAILVYYVEGIQLYLDGPQSSYIFAMFIKVPLFITMRYAEIEPESFVHDSEAIFF